jgi:hypothetical protein
VTGHYVSRRRKRMKPEKEKPQKKAYHKPRMTVYGDAVKLTDSSGLQGISDGGGGYTSTKTS